MTAKHLGGHAGITHIDAGAAEYIYKTTNPGRLYDIGCGPGGMVQHFLNMGIDCVGVDGDDTIDFCELPVLIHDFTRGPIELEPASAVWSCEFVEHVEERFMDNYFSAFKVSEMVFMTFSQTHGHHHVNCQPQEYWVKAFEDRGFAFLPKQTELFRASSTMHRDFVRKSGLVFLNMDI